ncbi:SGNH/GDSL hydrolase family protein [Bacillus sp. KH172YL63]|uniref:SGNH/GDSL hydrolase family protein n=1 Tax=Bacillus sp. KH172YL63 TaxID=2709784 RepID=UPI0013E511B9|nr:SGNH/GDSL hydrolase family protein [Bacillus sp. KH172YL63]BCB05805.1 hypothetical protein KH172YL63_39380 [Bacillus sp. KH172YL63]
MKKFFIWLLAIVTISTLVGGKLHWDKRVEAVQGINSTVTDEENEKNESEEKEKREKQLEKLNFLPPELKETFKDKMEREEPVHLMVLGSGSSSSREGAWPGELEKGLIDTYGKEFIKVSLNEVGNRTSQQVIEEDLHKRFAEMKPDILLLEPFLLADYEGVDLSDRLKNIDDITGEFKKLNPDIFIIIQPSNPIPESAEYTEAEAELENYSKERKFVYLNHWEAWPIDGGDEIKNYLTKDNQPNEKGNKVWFEYVRKYFIRG